MCGADVQKLDPTGFYQGVGDFYSNMAQSAFGTPETPKPIPPPRLPTKTADKIYGAKKDQGDEPQLLGTNALQIPLKTIQ